MVHMDTWWTRTLMGGSGHVSVRSQIYLAGVADAHPLAEAVQKHREDAARPTDRFQRPRHARSTDRRALGHARGIRAGVDPTVQRRRVPGPQAPQAYGARANPDRGRGVGPGGNRHCAAPSLRASLQSMVAEETASVPRPGQEAHHAGQRRHDPKRAQEAGRHLSAHAHLETVQ